MRVGQNPNKPAPAATSFQDVALCTVTHIPNTTTAYHSKRLEVVQHSLRSMRAGAQMEATVIVWDNGSIPALRDSLACARSSLESEITFACLLNISSVVASTLRLIAFSN